MKKQKNTDMGIEKVCAESFTRHMENMVREGMSLVSREDVKGLLKKYEAAPLSSQKSWKYRLDMACKQADAGFSADDVINHPENLLQIPSRKDHLTQLLYSMYRMSYSSEAYMARLVRLCAPEFEHETTRVAILKKFIKGCWKGYPFDMKWITDGTSITGGSSTTDGASITDRSSITADASAASVPGDLAGVAKDTDVYTCFRNCLLMKRNCDAIRIEGVIEWVADRMEEAKRDAWLWKWLGSEPEAQLKMLLSQIDDTIFTKVALTPVEDLRAMLDVMKTHFTSDPVAYYSIDRGTGNQYEIKDFSVCEKTWDSIRMFMEGNGIRPVLSEKMRVLDAVEGILTACGKRPELEQTICRGTDFYIQLKNDFRLQCRSIRRGPEALPLSQEEKKIERSAASNQGRLRLMIRKMNTFVYGTSNRTYCLWLNGHAEPVKDIAVDAVTFQRLKNFAEAHEVRPDGKRVLDYLTAIDAKGLSRKELAEKGDFDEEPVVDAVYRQYKQMRVNIRRNPGTDSPQRKYRDSQEKIRKQSEKTDEERKKNTRVWRDILELCENLAEGRFVLSGEHSDTIRSLYYFAYMFQMTVSIGNEPVCPDTDIERRLFQDYYADNVMIYLKDYDPGTDSSIEYEPSGAGINYKNYAETLYLFYLYQMNQQKKWKSIETLLPERGNRSVHLNLPGEAADRDEPVTPGEWLDRAEEMIARCKDEAQKTSRQNRKDQLKPSPERNTREYKENAFGQEGALLSFSAKREDEEKLIRFITENYQILPETGKKRPTVISGQMKTAWSLASELQKRMDEEEFSDPEYEYEYGDSPVLEYFDYRGNGEDWIFTGAEKAEARALLDTTFDWNVYANMLKKRYSTGEDERFRKMIDKANERLNRKYYGYRYEEALRTCYLLRCFMHHEKKKATFTLEEIQDICREYDPILLMNGAGIRKSAELLMKLGYPVRIEKEAGVMTGVCWEQLQQPMYAVRHGMAAEESSDALIRSVSVRNLIMPDAVSGLYPRAEMIRTLHRRIAEKADWPTTRTEYISVYVDWYMKILKQRMKDRKRENMGPAKLLEDFRKGNPMNLEEEPGMDRLLTEARFQPVSEKNFLDMYVVLSLYVYWSRIRRKR